MKRDAFEKMVNKVIGPEWGGEHSMTRVDILKLLRAQHRRFVSLVKREADKYQSFDIQLFAVRLLAALAAKGKGGKR